MILTVSGIKCEFDDDGFLIQYGAKQRDSLNDTHSLEYVWEEAEKEERTAVFNQRFFSGRAQRRRPIRRGREGGIRRSTQMQLEYEEDDNKDL